MPCDRRPRLRRPHTHGNNTCRVPPPLSSFLFLFITTSLLLSCTTRFVVHAEKDSNPYPWGENPNNKAFRMYWNDARNVLQDLDQFAALYVKYHGCVWSECTVDNYDDDGEGRDGDEYWYQYRTQPFCANAAFSLYGVKRMTLPWLQCSRGTYINSFFTYGGADTLLEAMGLTILSEELEAFTGGGNGNDDHNNNENNDNNNQYYSSGYHPNAVCYVDADENGGSGDNNNGDDITAGTSTTMGCSADGQRFVAAQFQGQTCDGSLFVETLGDMPNYNHMMRRNFGCRQLWARRRDWNDVSWFYDSSTDDAAAAYNNNNGENRNLRSRSTEVQDEASTTTTTTTTTEEAEFQNETADTTTINTTTSATAATSPERQLNNGDDDNYNANKFPSVPAWALLRNAWACDVSLYPSGCPDPFRLKRKYDGVLAAAGNGHSVVLAILHYTMRVPLIFLSILAGIAGVGLHTVAYMLSRRDKFKAVGVCTTLGADIKHVCVSCTKVLKKTVRMCCGLKSRKSRNSTKNGGRSSTKSGRSSTRSGSSSGRRKKRGSRNKKGSNSTSPKSDSYFSF